MKEEKSDKIIDIEFIKITSSCDSAYGPKCQPPSPEPACNPDF